MSRNKIVSEKINFFLKAQQKCHLTKYPTLSYPKGKWLNGIIVEKYDDHIIFDDPIENPLKPTIIFFEEIEDIEEFTEVKVGRF